MQKFKTSCNSSVRPAGNGELSTVRFQTRILIVCVVADCVSVIVSILLFLRHGTTWTAYGIEWDLGFVVALMVLLPASVSVIINYLY